MKPAAFEYFAPGTLDEAVSLLDKYNSEAKVLAGSQSLVPLMNFRLARPTYLVDINGIQDLSYIREEEGMLVIGAMTRQSEIEHSELAAEKCPLLVEATKLIGHATIRNRGTIGGSLAHADPASEYPSVFAALDGEVKVKGPAGERSIPAEEFFLTFFTTSISPDEIITEVRFPVQAPDSGSAFLELSRRHGDYAIVGVAVALSLDEEDKLQEMKMSLAGAGATPIRCHEAEALLQGKAASNGLFKDAAKKAADVSEPQADIHASADYKKAMVEVYVVRALEAALNRARREKDAS